MHSLKEETGSQLAYSVCRESGSHSSLAVLHVSSGKARLEGKRSEREVFFGQKETSCSV